MLRISKKADYAVFLLGAIARHGAYPGGEQSGRVVSAQEIARQAGLNKSVVANLLKAFTRHGMLESVRGLKGGYRLLRNPADISLEDILEIVEGRFELVDCVAAASAAGASIRPSPLALAPSMQPQAEAHDCALSGFCPSKHPMQLVHQRIAELFRSIRLDELCSLTPVTKAVTASAATSKTR